MTVQGSFKKGQKESGRLRSPQLPYSSLGDCSLESPPPTQSISELGREMGRTAHIPLNSQLRIVPKSSNSGPSTEPSGTRIPSTLPCFEDITDSKNGALGPRTSSNFKTPQAVFGHHELS